MFDNFISLGWYCGVASSIDNLAIRSRSGPFDWCFSDFKGVLECIMNDFNDLLAYDNLRMVPNI